MNEDRIAKLGFISVVGIFWLLIMAGGEWLIFGEMHGPIPMINLAWAFIVAFSCYWGFEVGRQHK